MSNYIVHNRVEIFDYFDDHDYYAALQDVVYMLQDTLNINKLAPDRPSLIRARINDLSERIARETRFYVYSDSDVWEVIEYV